MSDENGSRKFLRETLPMVLGPALLVAIGVGIAMLFTLSAQVQGLQRDVTQVPALSASVASQSAQLSILANEVSQLRQLTQGLDGSLRPEGTLSAEMKALENAVTSAVRQDTATRAQLDALIQALGRVNKPTQ